MAQFASTVNFLCVYIQEAHAIDTWPFGLEQSYRTTHTIDERCNVAREFIQCEQFEQELLIDVPPLSKFNELFAAWPLRFYVIDADVVEKSAKVSFIADPYGADMNVSFVKHYLETRFAKK